MSAQLNECPKKNTLIDYLLGKLPDEVLEACESHFAQCDVCEETIRGLNANDTLSQLTMAAATDNQQIDADDRNLVLGLIDRLKQGPSFNRQKQVLEDRAAEVTRLLDTSDDPDSIGELGHYKIMELIGAGSTGVVYRAMDRKLHRVVALKILRPSLGQAARERFMAEARAAAGIDHPNVITIYHVGDDESLAYMAMQWLPGETLEDRLTRVTFLPEKEVKHIGVEIASGLQAAHGMNLIHRDIKPANIWLREETGQAIILDFGLARIADDDPQLTNTGMLAGTPNFMSPEQTRGLELDGRSDLFSLGCLLYRAATGKLPFGSTGILATLQSIQSHWPAPPRELNPSVNPDFSDLIMCLLEKQPVNRPENAGQLMTALQKPRSTWRFVAANASHTKTEPPTKPQTQSGSSWFWWIAAAMCIGFFGWAMLLNGPQIIRVMTDKGELVIDAKDEDVVVEISKGDFVQVIDTKTNQTIDIKSGVYHLKVTDNQNAFELSNDSVTMTRGGKQIVTITRIKPEPAESKTQTNVYSPLANTSDEFYQAELNLAQAKQNVVRAESALKHSSQLLEKGFITAEQKKQDEMLLETAIRELDRAQSGLAQAMTNQKLMAEKKKEIDLIVARKLNVLEDNYNRVKRQYEQGLATPADVNKAEVEYLDAKLRLLDVHGGDGLAIPANNPNAATTPETPSGPTYDGQTFEQWSSILRTERNRDTICSGLRALGELALDKPELQEAAIEIVTPIVRKYGGVAGVSGKEGLVDGINNFFGLLPPERVVEFVRNEISNGTFQSRMQSQIMLHRIQMYKGRRKMQEKYREVLKVNLQSLLPLLIKHMEDSEGREKSIARILINAALSGCFDSNATLAESLNKAPPGPEIAEFLVEEMRSAQDPEVSTAIAASLVIFDLEFDEALTNLGNALNDPVLDPELLKECFYVVQRVGPHKLPMLIQPLIKLYENEQQCNRMFADLRPQPDDILNQIRYTIIGLFETMGQEAENALPFLDKVAAGDSQQRAVAKNTAQSIRESMEITD